MPEETVTTTLNYIFQLPATIICDLSIALDPGNYWEEIAFVMPGIHDIDIEACRRLGQGEHPTENLLRVWGSKGYSILDLYKIFFKTRLLRCMQILLPFVDKQFHYLVNICANESLSQQNAPSSIKSPTSGKVSAQLTNKNSASVYSRKGSNFASAEPSAGLSAGIAPSVEPPGGSTVSNSASTSADQNGSLLNGLQNTPAVKYDDLSMATNGFSSSNVIGRGGYGVVYKGMWKHTEVAIKRIQGKSGSDERHQRERIRQSLQELRTLAKFRHDNILSLYGYSLDGPEPCLVYQYMSNGTLEDRLLCRNTSKPLSWLTKLIICKGVGRGLHFLHTINQLPIIHGDVKSANILLDRHFEPKLGDFGLSRDGQTELDSKDKKPMIASHVKGTLAYLPPEFLTSRILTTKLDVYSFGVVLLEVATGQRAFSTSRDPQGIVDYVVKICSLAKQRNEKLEDNLADKRGRIEERISSAVFERLLSIGIDCTQKDRFSRPIFSEIFAQLNEPCE